MKCHPQVRCANITKAIWSSGSVSVGCVPVLQLTIDREVVVLEEERCLSNKKTLSFLRVKSANEVKFAKGL